jgi:DNA polymerase III delta subunit
MLYIYYGEDGAQVRAKSRSLITALQKKAPDAELVRITDESGVTVDIEGLLSTQGLFKQSYILSLDGVDGVFLGFSDIQLEAMKQSDHICIVLLEHLKPKEVERLKKYANKLVECKGQKLKKQSFDVFSAANALKSRNKQKLWQALTEARLSGIEAEALTGILFWAVKDMLVKGQTQKYSRSELQKLALIIASTPHRARREGVVVYNTLEKHFLTCV